MTISEGVFKLSPPEVESLLLLPLRAASNPFYGKAKACRLAFNPLPGLTCGRAEACCRRSAGVLARTWRRILADEGADEIARVALLDPSEEIAIGRHETRTSHSSNFQLPNRHDNGILICRGLV